MTHPALCVPDLMARREHPSVAAERWVIGAAERAFRRVLARDMRRGVPDLVDLRLDRETLRDSLLFTANFSDGYYTRWEVPREVLRDLRDGYLQRLPGLCRDVWQGLSQQHPAYRRAPYTPRVSLGVDVGRDEGFTFDLRPGALNYVRQEDLHYIPPTSVAYQSEIEARQVMMIAQAYNVDRSLLHDPFGLHAPFGTLDVGLSKETAAKAEKLLREWLSPVQLEQYDRDKSFTVVGSDTGRVFRIRSAYSHGIDELGAAGDVLGTYCVVPEGAPALGDIMLAQKVMLETGEKATLKKANRAVRPRGVGDGGVGRVFYETNPTGPDNIFRRFLTGDW